MQGKVIEIDPLQKRAFWRGNKSPAEEPDRVLQYDYLIAATGLQRNWPILPKSRTRQQYIQDAKSHIANIKDSRDHPVVVIGGGMCSRLSQIKYLKSYLCIFSNRSRGNRVHGQDQTLSPRAMGNLNPFPVYPPIE